MEALERKSRAVSGGWAVFGLICLASAIIGQAWWHLGTTAICAVMALAYWEDEDKD